MSQENCLESREELHDIIKGWCLHSSTIVTQEGQGATAWVTDGGEETPLSAVRPCGMDLSPNEALDTSRSLHLTMGYLLRVGCGNLEFKVGWLRQEA